MLYGINPSFPRLSLCVRQIVHALLTRPPLTLNRSSPSARLACVKHAASVRPEPGSNSDVQSSSVRSGSPLPPHAPTHFARFLPDSNGDSLILRIWLFVLLSFSLYRFQGSPLFWQPVAVTTLMIIRPFPRFVNTFFEFFRSFFRGAKSLSVIYRKKNFQCTLTPNVKKWIRLEL